MNWEYKTVNVGPGENHVDVLNPHGAVGWEAYAVYTYGGWTTYYCKRHSNKAGKP